MKGMRVAIVGATGAVGRTMLEILAGARLPAGRAEPARLRAHRGHAAPVPRRGAHRRPAHARGARGRGPRALELRERDRPDLGASGRRGRHHRGRQLERVPDGAVGRARDPRGQPRGARARREGLRRAELHDHHRADGARAAAPRGRAEGREPVVVPVGLGRRREGRPRARRAGREAPRDGGRPSPPRPRRAARGRGVRQDDRLQRGRQDRRVRPGLRVHVRGDQGAARGQAPPVAARARHLRHLRPGPGAGWPQREPARDVRAAVLGGRGARGSGSGRGRPAPRRPGQRRLPEPPRGRGDRRHPRRPDPSARGSRRRAAALRLRRQPP